MKSYRHRINGIRITPEKDYQKSIIYGYFCYETGEVYIGSTITTLEDRDHNHHCDRNRCMSKQIIQRGNYRLDIIEHYPCDTKDQLCIREDWWIARTPNCINKIRAFLTLEERKEYQAKWFKKNYDRSYYSVFNRLFKEDEDEDEEEDIGLYKLFEEIEPKISSQEYKAKWYVENKARIRDESKERYNNDDEYRGACVRRAAERHERVRGDEALYAIKLEQTRVSNSKFFKTDKGKAVQERRYEKIKSEEKTVCECGAAPYNSATKWCHMNTKKHKDWLNSTPASPPHLVSPIPLH